MASATEDNAFAQSAPYLVDSIHPEFKPDAHGFQLHNVEVQSPGKTVPASSAQGANLHDESQVPTPASPPSATPRVTGTKGNTTVKKSRRVRTGCLTCRERHLKCDEALHTCQNCRKSNRICRRGLRLNFIDTQTAAPPHPLLPKPGTQLTFRDDSRMIASEYVGGFERYPPPELDIPIVQYYMPQSGDYLGLIGPNEISQPNLSVPSLVSTLGVSQSEAIDILLNNHTFQDSLQDQNIPYSLTLPKQKTLDSDGHAYLNNPEDIFLMQVFVDEIGIWMESTDRLEHFTRVLPYRALEEPMLLKALLACGARHSYHLNPSFGESKASYLYEEASRELLSSLQNPDRDSYLCATIAVVLSVYEAICFRLFHGRNHTAGARALIKECGWNARTPGLGGACVWLDIQLELLNCLQFNWALAWNPDNWGVDMNMEREPTFAGDEEMWAHRMVYICAKLSDFRASHFHALGRTGSEVHVNQRYQEWEAYSRLCDQWSKSAPRSMAALGYLHPWQTHSKSAFPGIWLTKRPAIIARLFYHTARLLLSRTYPLESEFSPGMRNMQQTHAHDICGIIAHTKDPALANLSIRFLVIAAECLFTREAQEEALRILDDLIKRTGWPAEYLKDELQVTWGWNFSHPQNSVLGSAATIPERPKSNPLITFSDFSMENHPYQNYYVPPHHSVNHFPYAAF